MRRAELKLPAPKKCKCGGNGRVNVDRQHSMVTVECDNTECGFKAVPATIQRAVYRAGVDVRKAKYIALKNWNLANSNLKHESAVQ